VVKIANIGYSKFIFQNQEYLPNEYQKEFTKYIVNPNTILMALTRPITNNTLKVCIYPKDTKTGLLNQRVAMIISDHIAQKFLFLYMQTLFFNNQVTKAMSETLQPNLSPLMLENFLIPLPSLIEQNKIIEVTESQLSIIDEVEKVLEINTRKADQMRQSILKRAFEGKLVPQDPTDEPAERLLERIKGERAKREIETKSDKKSGLRQMELVRFVK
jgi:type I restriction enzyme S subunit